MNLIILSSSYLDQEMRVEFGSLPPAFLPVGNKTLLERQAEQFPSHKIFLTLPDCYSVNEMQSTALSVLNVELIYLSKELGIGEVVAKVANKVGLDCEVKLLFGDTLISYTAGAKNVIYISNTSGYYRWSIYSKITNSFSLNTDLNEEKDILSGFLDLCSLRKMVTCLSSNGNDFITSVNQMLATGDLSTKSCIDWYDFGHLHSYFESKKKFTTERVFNKIEASDKYLYKTSENVTKINAELKWFQNIPEELKIYVPLVFKRERLDGYNVEYLRHLTLSELFCFCKLPGSTLTHIISACFSFLDELHSVECSGSSGDWNVAQNLKKRWQRLPDEQRGQLEELIRLNKFSMEGIIKMAEGLSPYSNEQRLIHGDFCFSNILYDFRSQRVRVIDPRGCDFSEKTTQTGPAFYDYCKLSHSILGRYDEINIGSYRMEEAPSESKVSFYENENYRFGSELLLTEFQRRNISVRDIYLGQAILFLSMIPLHYDDSNKQQAFVLNAIRLLKEYRQK